MFKQDPAIWLKELLLDTGSGYNLASIPGTSGFVLTVILLDWPSNVFARMLIVGLGMMAFLRFQKQNEQLVVNNK
ncbi:MAG: hypothetical protein NT092_03025 [Bacteroidia bacterium]|nr:hypothetical protein [Bacteroidia bacterium]